MLHQCEEPMSGFVCGSNEALGAASLWGLSSLVISEFSVILPMGAAASVGAISLYCFRKVCLAPSVSTCALLGATFGLACCIHIAVVLLVPGFVALAIHYSPLAKTTRMQAAYGALFTSIGFFAMIEIAYLFFGGQHADLRALFFESSTTEFAIEPQGVWFAARDLFVESVMRIPVGVVGLCAASTYVSFCSNQTTSASPAKPLVLLIVGSVTLFCLCAKQPPYTCFLILLFPYVIVLASQFIAGPISVGRRLLFATCLAWMPGSVLIRVVTSLSPS